MSQLVAILLGALLRRNVGVCGKAFVLSLMFLSPTNALPIERTERCRLSHDRLSNGDCRPKLFACQMPDRRAFDDCVPGCPHDGIQADTHETMVIGNRPTACRRHSRHHIAHEYQPLANERRAFVGIIEHWCQCDRKKRMLVCHAITSKCHHVLAPNQSQSPSGHLHRKEHLVAAQWTGCERIIIIGIGRLPCDGDLAVSEPRP